MTNAQEAAEARRAKRRAERAKRRMAGVPEKPLLGEEDESDS